MVDRAKRRQLQHSHIIGPLRFVRETENPIQRALFPLGTCISIVIVGVVRFMILTAFFFTSSPNAKRERLARNPEASRMQTLPGG